jgi:hypothetical protein
VEVIVSIFESADVNVVGENIDTIQKNTKAVLDASKKVGLEVNPE